MANELYAVLGVAKDASSGEIKSAYRTLAKKHHPDLNPGDKLAEETFKNIQSAHAILSDKEKRWQYDDGAIDSEGKEVPRQYYREYASADGANPYQSTASYDDLGDMFSDLFRARGQGGANANIRMPGGDIRYAMEITFLEAVNGAKKRVTMPDGKALDVKIPVGQRDGQVLRLRGQGMPGLGGGPAGDAYVEMQVAPHANFRRYGNNIHLDLPVALHEAILGARLRVQTISGAVTMTIPSGSNTGDTLRLKGKGVQTSAPGPAGDHIVTLRVVLPKQPDDQLKEFMESWGKEHDYDPRQDMEG